MIAPDAPSYRERAVALLLAAAVVVPFRLLGGLPEFVASMVLVAVAALLAAVLMDEQTWSARARRRALLVVFLSSIAGLILR
jgi:TctA family transporter